MKKQLCLFVFCLLLALPSFAQTAANMDELMQTQAVSYRQAAWLVLQAADIADLNPDAAFAYALERKWLPAGAAPEGQARLDGISLLLMRAFQIKGGLFYSIAKNAHYAYRELAYQGVIFGRADPAMTVPGGLLLFMTGKVLSWTEDA